MLRTDALRTNQTIANSSGARVALPSSAKRADQRLIEGAISHIRIVLAETVGRGMDEVGCYLLRNFYDDDPRLYFSANPKKHVSLRLLMDRCETLELPVGRTFLCNALRMAAIAKGLPRTAKFHILPSSHRLQLLRLKDSESVEPLAAQAISEKVSVLKLRDLVDKELEQGGAGAIRGRRRKPPMLHAIGSCLQNLRDEQTGKLLVSRSDIRDMTALERTRAKAGLIALQRCLKELRRLIR